MTFDDNRERERERGVVYNTKKNRTQNRTLWNTTRYSGVSRVGLKGGGVSKSRKIKWLVKVGACKDVNPLI